ncbi:MAG: hypothetical protein AAB091_06000, partial [Elusimicrobiota bacterium]
CNRPPPPAARFPIFIAAYAALLALWANIHGGFVLALGILGLQLIGSAISMANAWFGWRVDRELTQEQYQRRRSHERLRLWALAALGMIGLAATLINPYGIEVYKVIIKHLRDAPFISNVIMEWQPTRFDQAGTWRYWGVFFFAISVLITSWIVTRKFDFEGTFVVLAFGLFAQKHIRNIALFGLVSMPVLWQAVLPLVESWRWPGFSRAGWPRRVFWQSAALALMALGVAGSGYFLAKQGWTAGRNLARYRGLPRAYLSAGNYPELACQFLERYPELLKLNIWTEWGWGGFCIWRLHDKGARFFFDGRYIFHNELHELMHHAENSNDWGRYIKSRDVELAIVKHPELDEYQPARTLKINGRGYDQALRSWRAMAYPASDWALVWWDNASLVFLRRGQWPKSLPASVEYASRLAVDPFWVEYQVRKKWLKPEDLLAELKRNGREAGWNFRNLAFVRIVTGWQSGKF